MPSSKPTQSAAFTLRISKNGSEKILYFRSFHELSMDIGSRFFRIGKSETRTGSFTTASEDGLNLDLCVHFYSEFTTATGFYKSALKVETTSYEAFGPGGKSIKMHNLWEQGSILNKNRIRKKYSFWSFSNYQGYGTTVPHVRKHRGGYKQFRRIHTYNERRLNQYQRPDYVEPEARAARQRKNLPNYWDDISRNYERNWKSQHKGKKSWDKGLKGG